MSAGLVLVVITIGQNNAPQVPCEVCLAHAVSDGTKHKGQQPHPAEQLAGTFLMRSSGHAQ